MHPLAIEDVIHHHGNSARSKADYYPQHLFLRILCHRLASEGDWDIASEVLEEPDDADVGKVPRSESPGPMEDSDYEKTWQGKPRTSRQLKSVSRLSEDVEMIHGVQVRSSGQPPKVYTISRTCFACLRLIVDCLQKTHSREWKVLQQLKMENEDRVSVKISPVCIFLFRDGKVLTNDLMIIADAELFQGTVISVSQGMQRFLLTHLLHSDARASQSRILTSRRQFERGCYSLTRAFGRQLIQHCSCRA